MCLYSQEYRRRAYASDRRRTIRKSTPPEASKKLTGTSRRGNKYLRKLFVQGAHTVLLQKTKQSSGLSTWLVNLASRKRGKQVATVALANKMARIAWAVCWRTMRWHNGRSRRSQKPVWGKCLQGSVTKKDEGAAHSIQARSSLLQLRPNTFAQTNSVIFIFRLQNGGGPYIPHGCNRFIRDSTQI